MPSKRHGYLTRKEWLAERLADSRDHAGAFDVERLLRSFGPGYRNLGMSQPAWRAGIHELLPQPAPSSWIDIEIELE